MKFVVFLYNNFIVASTTHKYVRCHHHDHEIIYLMCWDIISRVKHELSVQSRVPVSIVHDMDR